MTEPVRTTCPYCGVGCGLLLHRAGAGWRVEGDPEHPANYGRLCSKGAALAETLGQETRLLHPLLRGERVSWSTALDAVAQALRRTLAEHGPQAVAFYVSGQLLTEDYYVANKLMKGFLGAANIDTNSRLCMASAVAGHVRAFGEDVVPATYADVEAADLVVLIGSNAAWTHPVLFQRLQAARQARPQLKVVVIDPRRTATAEAADLHLALAPGTDAWLLNGLLDYLRRESGIDWAWVEAHVAGFGAAFAAVAGLTIPLVAEHCGLKEAEVATFYRWFAATERSVTLFSQGINQSSSGTDKVNAILNLHLATGRIGRPGMGPFSLTGQPNAMGGREVGGLATQLAAHMDFAPERVEAVARFWGAPRIARAPGLKAVDLFEAVQAGEIKFLWIMATNPAVSLPQAERVRQALERCPCVVVSDMTAHTDTARYAHVLLPAAAWGEKDGTVTNSERRISRCRPFLAPAGEARPDWWMVAHVARRLGHGDAFAYRGPAAIFREHARLTTLANDGTRRFDLGPLAGLSDADYDRLPPTLWPLGQERPYADGRFSTADGRARMLPIHPRAPAAAPHAAHPIVLNTGRLRDQWHTMTRTGLSPRLSAHCTEPCVELHPADITRLGLAAGGLARLHSPHGEAIARVLAQPGQRPGEAFLPMHWNGRFSARAWANALTAAVTDPISGQPEFKHTPVAVSPYAADWYGLALSRTPLTVDHLPYWSVTPARGCWRYGLAGRQGDLAGLHAWFEGDGELAEFADPAAGRWRAALMRDGRLERLVFIEREPQRLPERSWLEALFERERLTEAERAALLLGSPPSGTASEGRVVCACHGVGEARLAAAIAAGARSVEALGAQLKAGTHCGSCVPELRRLLRQAAA
ncbi:MAG: molybdopterin-dependent oxidoreductase [Thiobacillaceae bacterium]|nr:molybdopterin-dependent oxidoreductase [Thiobacillaceae bacterium]